MADIYQQQSQNREWKMDFDDRFQLLVDYEYDRRRSYKLELLIKQVTLNEPVATMEDIEYHPEHKLNKQLILELAGGNYIQRHQNITLMGASGNGKTWIANAFRVQACRQFFKNKYIRLPELLD